MNLSRRTVLRGFGTLVALPFLESIPALAQTPPRRRFLAYFTPNGVNTADWNLDGALARLSDSPTINSLAPRGLLPYLTLVQGLSCAHRPPPGGGHHRGVAGFLTATTCMQGTELKLCANPPEMGYESCAPSGPSIDQWLARQMPRATRFRSLELGPTNNSINGGECGGFPCAYLDNISWIDGSTPAARETNPARAFDRLFAGLNAGESEAARLRRKAKRLRVLDFVKDDADRLKRRLGRDDHRRVDQYFSALTDLEDQLRTEPPPPATCTPGERPLVEGADVDDPTEYVRAFNRLMLLALQCDLTRVASFMVGGGGNSGSYKYPQALIGHGPLPGGRWDFSSGYPSGVEQVKHHELSHWRNAEGFDGEPPSREEFSALKYQAVALIDRWLLGLFGEMLDAMKQITDGPNGETLLDNTLAYYSSELSDGDAHSTLQLPILLAGRGAGLLEGNRVVSANDTVANLFIAIAERFGVPLATFGNDGTRALSGVFV